MISSALLKSVDHLPKDGSVWSPLKMWHKRRAGSFFSIRMCSVLALAHRHVIACFASIHCIAVLFVASSTVLVFVCGIFAEMELADDPNEKWAVGRWPICDNFHSYFSICWMYQSVTHSSYLGTCSDVKCDESQFALAVVPDWNRQSAERSCTKAVRRKCADRCKYDAQCHSRTLPAATIRRNRQD